MNYLIKNKNNELISFYDTAENTICFRKWENGLWSDKTVLINDVRHYFSVNVAENGSLYLICQNKRGDVIVCSENNGTWKNQVILHSTTDNGKNVLFYAIINNTSMELIYSIDYGKPDYNSYNRMDYNRNDYNKNNCEIMSQHKSSNGETLGARLIDKAIPFSDGIFQLQKISKNHYVVFYQRQGSENQIGYRELTTDRISDFFVFHKTGNKIIDASFITQPDGIHFLYIVKSLFSSQLIYRRKDENGIHSPVVLYEGQNLSFCNMFFFNNKLYACWIMNKQLFYSVSDCNGDSFDRPIRDKILMNTNLEKGFYIDSTERNNTNFFATELLFDAKTPWEPILINDIHSSFYPQSVQPIINNISNNNNNNNNYSDYTNYNYTPPEEFNQTLARMENQLYFAQQQSNTKDKQLIQLNNIIQSKNEEIIATENSLNQKIKQLQIENAKLNEEKNLLIKENSALNQENLFLKKELEKLKGVFENENPSTDTLSEPNQKQ